MINKIANAFLGKHLKGILFVTALLLLFATQAFAAETLIATGPEINYAPVIDGANGAIGVVYFDDEEGIKFSRTTNDGATWTESTIEAFNNVWGAYNVEIELEAVDDQTFYVLYRRKLAYQGSPSDDSLFFAKTIDGGSTWNVQVIKNFSTTPAPWPMPNMNLELKALNANQIVATYLDASVVTGPSLAERIEFIRSDDSGTTWQTTTITEEGYNSISHLSVIDADVLFAIQPQNGGGYNLYKTTDGGTTWNLTSTLDFGFSTIADFKALNNNEFIVFFAYDNPTYSKSTDGGMTWSTPQEIYNVYGIKSPVEMFVSDDKQNILIPSKGTSSKVTMHKSIDSGTTWTTIESTKVLSLPTITFYGKNEDILFITYTVQAINKLNFPNAENITDGVYVLSSFDGGATWDQPTPGTPVIENISNISVYQYEDIEQQVNVTDTATPLIYELTQNPEWASIDSTGLITGTPPAGSGGQYTGTAYPVTVKVTNANAISSEISFNVVVNSTIPIIGSILPQTFNVGELVEIQTPYFNPFPPAVYELIDAPVWLNVDATGLISGIAEGEGDFSGKIQVTNSYGESALQWFNGTIILNAPILETIENQTLKHGELLTIQVTDNNPFPPLLYNLLQAPEWVSINDTGFITGTVEGTLGDQFIEVEITNTYGQTGTTQFTVNVQENPPVIEAINNQTITEGGNLEVQVIDINPFEPLTYDLLQGPNWVNIDNTGLITGIAPLGNAGIYSIDTQVTNSYGDASTADFTVTVNALPLIIEAIPNQTLSEEDSFQAQVNPESAYPPFTYSLVALNLATFTPILWVTVNETGEITGTAPLGSEGQYGVSVTVNDELGRTENSSFQVTVTEAVPATPPIITPITNQTMEETETLALQVTVTDDFPPLQYALLNAPNWLTIDSTGLITGTAPENSSGNYELEVNVTNNESLSSSASFTLTVNSTIPRISASDEWIRENAEFSYTIKGKKLPLQGNEISSVLSEGPEGMILLQSENHSPTLFWNSSRIGTYPITVLITDNEGNTLAYSFTLTVYSRDSWRNQRKFIPIEFIKTPQENGETERRYRGRFETSIPVEFTLIEAPQGMEFLSNEDQGELRWNNPIQGSFPITIQAENMNETIQYSFELTITGSTEPQNAGIRVFKNVRETPSEISSAPKTLKRTQNERRR